jgi:DNA-binding LytR/AlgR family response regulator
VSCPSQARPRDPKRTRVRLDEILAVGSGVNKVEFALRDGRRLLILRTRRSLLVNSGQVTALRPEGSGDRRVELGPRAVPLSRRFPQALEIETRGCSVSPHGIFR